MIWNPTRSKNYSVHLLFHQLWTKAVGTPEYVKQEWRSLEETLLEAYPVSEQSASVIQYRLLWTEQIADKVVPFSGRVYTNFDECHLEMEDKRKAYNFHGIMIEARPFSDKLWPRPWDGVTVTKERQ